MPTISPPAGARPLGPPRPVLGDRPAAGMAIMLAAGLGFSLSDALSKELALTLPVAEVAWLRWIGFTLAALPALVASRGGVLHSRAPLWQMFRSLGLLGSSLLFVAGTRLLPLASATTINFVSPLIVTALSIPFLGEKVGMRRWAAIAVGLVGVLVVVRPGSGTFGPAAAFPILSAVSWACAVIVTRRLGGLDRPWTAMTYTALVGLLLLSAAVPFVFVPPSPRELALAAVMAVFATTGQFCTVLAFQRAPASLLAPFTYMQLIWASALGYLLFGNLPDGWTWLGALIIVASGVYTAHRERVRARAERGTRRGLSA